MKVTTALTTLALTRTAGRLDAAAADAQRDRRRRLQADEALRLADEAVAVDAAAARSAGEPFDADVQSRAERLQPARADQRGRIAARAAGDGAVDLAGEEDVGRDEAIDLQHVGLQSPRVPSRRAALNSSTPKLKSLRTARAAVWPPAGASKAQTTPTPTLSARNRPAPVEVASAAFDREREVVADAHEAVERGLGERAAADRDVAAAGHAERDARAGIEATGDDRVLDRRGDEVFRIARHARLRRAARLHAPVGVASPAALGAHAERADVVRRRRAVVEHSELDVR